MNIHNSTCLILATHDRRFMGYFIKLLSTTSALHTLSFRRYYIRSTYLRDISDCYNMRDDPAAGDLSGKSSPSLSFFFPYSRYLHMLSFSFHPRMLSAPSLYTSAIKWLLRIPICWVCGVRISDRSVNRDHIPTVSAEMAGFHLIKSWRRSK